MVKIDSGSYRNVVLGMLRSRPGRRDRMAITVLKDALNCRYKTIQSIRLNLDPPHNRL
jgi:hypothetical protein